MELNKDTLWNLFKAFTSTQEDSATVEPSEQEIKKSVSPAPLIKQNKFDEEKMQAIEVMYCPPEEDDLHGERMTEEEIRNMVDNFNANIDNVSGNLGHILNTEKFKPIKAWVNEVECQIGDEIVAEGTPLVKIQFYDEDLYQARKTGQLQGLSVGATYVAKTEED